MTASLTWRHWIPDAVLGFVVLVVGLVEIDGNIFFGLEPAPISIVVGLAVAVGLSRALPGAALALAWLIGASTSRPTPAW